jgi:Cd2+/Zn2+-exporting ATPase
MPLLIGGGLFALGLILSRVELSIAANCVFVGAYLLLGFEILAKAAKNLVKGHVFDENFLMSIATLGAFLIGEFPEAVGVMLFYRVGEYFEHRAVERSRKSIMAAIDLRPETVTLVHGDHTETIAAADAKIGDILLVRPGDRIPLDGVVVSGESRIDTAPITGEPVPVRVSVGDRVISGCVNTSGKLTVKVEKPLAESMVTRILNSVENAAASKPQIDRFITRFARIYTPIVVAAAALTALIPSLITGNWGYWVYTALSFLVMSCPCALVLSVPLAFFSGIGVGSKKGILFKGGASIEAMAKLNCVALDKTGTVTKGDFAVQQVMGGDEILALCAACEQYSTHPIAVSILRAAREKDLTLAVPESIEELSGRGIRGVVGGKTVLCGNRQLMIESGLEVDEISGTVVYVAVNGALAGHITIADTLKSGAAQAITRLHDLGIATAMLTGDSQETAHAVAKATGIQAVHAKLLPHEKLDTLRSIRAAKGSTMFVGDGINDAPVLAGADVGGAMGSGADAAIEAADVVYMTSDIQAVPDSISIARRTQAIAWQNVVFALAIKAAVMVLGLFGYASMWMAVFADSGVAMLCVLNSIRLLYRKH